MAFCWRTFKKNIQYDIEHIYCEGYVAIKNHYLLIRISSGILRQLLEWCSEALKRLNTGIKEISSRLLESFRWDKLTTEDIKDTNQYVKIR